MRPFFGEILSRDNTKELQSLDGAIDGDPAPAPATGGLQIAVLTTHTLSPMAIIPLKMPKHGVRAVIRSI
jgi:hypothetical protein